MQKNKQKLAKKYTALILLLALSSFILCTCTMIGYFTSKKDDVAYVQAIAEDIDLLKAKSTNGDYLRINKLTETGVFYIHKSDDDVYFTKPHTLSQLKLRDESNKSKSTFIQNDFENSKENVKLANTYNNIKNTKFMQETGLFSSFGNVFCYRLYPLVVKVFVNITEFLKFDGFVMILLDDESVRVGLYEDDGTVTNMDYWFRNEENMPNVKDVMKHMLFRFNIA